MEDDTHSWKDRCDRYFSSLSENGDHNQNGHVKNKEKSNTENQQPKADETQSLWKDLVALRKRSMEHPVIGYIRNAVYRLDIHGAKLAGKSTHNIELLIWGIIILAVFCFTTFLVILQFSDYLENKTSFQTHSVTSSDIVTSSVTISICNSNILRRSSLTSSDFAYLINDSMEIFKHRQGEPPASVKSLLRSNTKLSELLQASNGEINITRLLEQDIVIRELMRFSNESVLSRLRGTGSISWFHDVVDLNESDVKNYGHQLDDVIVKCFIGTRECNKSDLSLSSSVTLGNCVTFPPAFTSETVQFILNAEANEYIIGASPFVGFKLFIHGNGNDVTDGQEMNVGVSSLTSVHINKEIVTKRQDSTCIGEPGSKQKCLNSCHDNYVREYCGCSINSEDSTNACMIGDIENLLCRKAVTLLLYKGSLKCGCKDSCRERLFEMTRSTLNWPSSSYMPILSSMLTRNNLDLTESQIRENIAAVNIDLRTKSLVMVEETKQLQILDLLARFGGLLAFVAGLSMLTLVEIVWTSLKSLFDACTYIHKRSSGEKDAERLSDSQITSVTWAMYKQKRRQEELDKENQMNNARTDKRKVQSSGLGGNVNNRLHRRNSGYLTPINENHNDSPEGHSARHSVPFETPAIGNDYKYTGSAEPYELKGSKYRVSNPTSDSVYTNANGHIPKPYSDTNGRMPNGISLISAPYSNNSHYNGNEHVRQPYGHRHPSQHLDRGPFEKGNDRVQLYGNTSAYFHTNVSEPTFL